MKNASIFTHCAVFLTLFCLPLQAKPEISGNILFTENSRKYAIVAQELITQLNHPWGMTWLDDETMLISERNGRLWVYSGSTLNPVSNLPGDVYQKGQGGWMDLAMHPDGWIYLSYARGTATENTTALIRFTLHYDANSRERFSAKNVTTIFIEKPPKGSRLHFGAPIAIATDGTIFLGLGERGLFRHEAQNNASHLGSIIHITADGKPAKDNPFLQTTQYPNTLPEIYSYGHRNIQGIFYDSRTNSLYAHEHGPQGGDELNYIQPGKNYGWPIITYGREYGSGKAIGEGVAKEGMEQPIRQWTPSPAFSGMTRYYGNVFPEWNSHFFIGALKFQRIYRIKLAGNKVVQEEELLKNKVGRIRSLRTGPDGCIYLLTDERNGKLIKLFR